MRPTMTIDEIRRSRKKILLYVSVTSDEGTHFPISRAAFFRSLPDWVTEVNAVESEEFILVG